MSDHVINIAYDRKNGIYIAYNVVYNIFVRGVCVETACEEYRKAYKNQMKRGV